MKTLMLWLLPVIFLCSFCSVAFWIFLSNNNVSPKPSSKIVQKVSDTQSCKGCKDSAFIAKALGNYSNKWKKHEANFKRFRSLLSGKCHAVSKAVVTQNNTPLGSVVIYDGERRKQVQVTKALFNLLAKEQPFGNATWETCAVVGNGGILTNSSCGEEINSAQFVIRCNLPPLDNRYEKDVGNKTNLVTANPSILHEKFSGLMERRRPFVESLRPYGQALMLLPAFSYVHNTPVSLRAFYTLEDFGNNGPLPIFLNPEYMRSVHPADRRRITNHYYDDRESKKNVHSMPTEFEHLFKLHKQGVVRIHLGECQPARSSLCSRTPFPMILLFPHLHSLPRLLPISTHHLHLDLIIHSPFIMDSLLALLACSYC